VKKNSVVVRKPAPERLAYKPKELAKMLGLAQGTIYELIAQRALESVTVGRRIIVPAEAIRRFLAGDNHGE